MVEANPKAMRLSVATLLVWGATAAIAWLAIDANVALVGVKSRGLQSAQAAALERPDLEVEQILLEKTMVWPMQRDGLPPAAKVTATTVEKKIVWNIAATVVRTKQSYLLVFDQETMLITQINVGDFLPDGSKLLQVAIGSYTVRAKDGKKRTVDTSL